MIIGLGYRARVGKDTVAEFLRSGHGFRKIAFADALKCACAAIFGLTPSQLYGDEKDKVDAFWQDTPRNILQKVGTECLRRGYRDDVWIKAVERVVKMVGGSWVISDVRFPNEAEAIRAWGGFLVRVTRPNAPLIATATHASETALANCDPWDYYLCNDRSLDELARQVDVMVESLRGLR